MLEEENKIVAEEVTEEDDFADAVKPVIAQEEPKEEKEPEPEPVKEPEPAPEPIPDHYDYEDDVLKEIDESRSAFLKAYKKGNGLKILVTALSLVIIVAGWLIPSAFSNLDSKISMAISIVCAVIGIAVLGVYSFLSRKKSTAQMKGYFNTYYELSYKYALKDIEHSEFKGDLDSKLADAEFSDNGLYKDVWKIGSRYATSFIYHGMEASIIDCAAQIKGNKALQTVFVGKYLRTPNTYTGTGIVIYFKGNDRALPPTNISEMNVLEDSKKFTIYGEASEKKYLTHDIKTAIARVQTNKILVDVAIAIKPHKTYFLLGYEDDLMVIPLQNPMNPRPIGEFKENLAQFLEMAELFNK